MVDTTNKIDQILKEKNKNKATGQYSILYVHQVLTGPNAFVLAL
jgi:hypothetical protein